MGLGVQNMIHPDVERIALLGWHVYPQSAYSRAGCFEGAHAAATDDLDTIDKWCQDYPGCNWRVVFGSSGLVGFDCDVPPLHLHDGVAAMAALVAEHGQLPPRPTARSPNTRRRRCAATTGTAPDRRLTGATGARR